MDFLSSIDVFDHSEPESCNCFHNWSKLPPEMKMIIVNNLDIYSRIKLSFCSKQDYRIVHSSSFQVSKIEIEEKKNKDDSEPKIPAINVRICFLKNDGGITLKFAKQNNDTVVTWKKRMDRGARQRCIVFDRCDYYEKATGFIEEWLRHNVREIFVAMNRIPTTEKSVQVLDECRKLHVISEDENVMKWWLERVRPNLESLQLSNRFRRNPLSTQFLSWDHFKLSDFVHIECPADMTDEQFLRMEARNIDVESSTVTEQAVNTFLRKWIQGEVRKDFVRLQISFRGNNPNDSEIIKDIRAEKIIFTKDRWGWQIVLINDAGKMMDLEFMWGFVLLSERS